MRVGCFSSVDRPRAGCLVTLLVAIVLGAAVEASSRPLAEPAVEAGEWSADARSLRDKTGSRFTYVCPADGRPSQIWGTDIYTDDSSVCMAAVHKGVITVADGSTVVVEHLPGRESYTGSTRNGVTSANWGSYAGSFQVIGGSKGSDVAGVKMGGGGWTATATAYRGQNGTRLRFVCPAGGQLGTAYGTNVYTDDSSVCTAAVHMGLIKPADGGRVTIEIRPGQQTYTSSTHNGVTSRQYGTWNGSFAFVGATQLPGGGGGGGSTTPTTGGGTVAPPTATATGTVTVNGRPFTSGTVPFNATVDVTDGTLKLKSTAGNLTVNSAGDVPAAFKLVRGTENRKPIVELRLAKGDFSACPKRKTSGAAQAPTAAVRQLWGNGKGSFRTRGKYAAATVRGTRWLTVDRCDGTQVKVARGVVQVTDLAKRRQVTVRAGSSYLAKP
jgi:hypothetical protein